MRNAGYSKNFQNTILQGNCLQTIQQQTSSSFREKGSKFIGYLFPAEDLHKFEAKLEEIQSHYPDATHHCYAYRLDPNKIKEFAQDDGEPSGTAGLPILNQLKSCEIVNAGLVVVRYYGGTNLGTSGLIQAYGHSAEVCIGKADLHTVIPTRKIRLDYAYQQQNEIDQLKSSFNLIELEAEYMAEVTLTLACPLPRAEDLMARLQRMEHLGISYEDLGKDFVID